MLKFQKMLLRSPEGDGGGAGAAPPAGGTGGAPNAGGSDDPLFGGGTGTPPAGNQGGAGGGAPAGDPPASGAGTGSAPPPVSIPANWKDALPPEVKDAPWMKNVPDIPTLVKNYENAQKMVGADKIAIPGKNGSPEQWNEVFRKLGVPDKLEDYKYEVGPNNKADKEFLNEFNKAALDAKLLPTQAAKIADFFSDLNERVWADVQKQREVEAANKIQELKKEWGGAYDRSIIEAKSAVMEFADEKEREYFQKSGLGKDPMFIRLMAKVGKTLAEDKILGGSGAGGGGRLTPAQALAKIDEIKQNPKDPYWDAQHPGHLAAKKEYTLLFEQAYPPQQNNS